MCTCKAQVHFTRDLPTPYSIYCDEKWHLEVFDKQNCIPFFMMERAHRIPAWSLPPGNPMGPFILKLLHYKDRDNILSMVRTKGNKENRWLQSLLFSRHLCRSQETKSKVHWCVKEAPQPPNFIHNAVPRKVEKSCREQNPLFFWHSQSSLPVVRQKSNTCLPPGMLPECPPNYV